MGSEDNKFKEEYLATTRARKCIKNSFSYQLYSVLQVGLHSTEEYNPLLLLLPSGDSQVCYSVRHNLGHRVYRDRNSSLYHRIREGLQNRDPAPVPANHQAGVFHSV